MRPESVDPGKGCNPDMQYEANHASMRPESVDPGKVTAVMVMITA